MVGMRDNGGIDAGALCTLKSRGFGFVGNDDGDFCRVITVLTGIDQRLQVRTAARNENAELKAGHQMPALSKAWVRLSIVTAGPLPRVAIRPIS